MTAKKIINKIENKKSIAAAVVHNATEEIKSEDGRLEQLIQEVSMLKAELSALKARLFHPSEN